MRFIHVDKCSYSSFAFTTAFHCMTLIYLSLLLIDTCFSCFAVTNSAAISFIIYVSICSCTRAFFLWGVQTHSVSFPCSVLYLRNLTNGRCWQEREEKSECVSASCSDDVASAPLAPIPQVHPGSSFCPETPTNSWSSVASVFCLSRLRWEWVPEMAGPWSPHCLLFDFSALSIHRSPIPLIKFLLFQDLEWIFFSSYILIYRLCISSTPNCCPKWVHLLMLLATVYVFPLF